MGYGSNVGCPGSLHLFESLIDAILTHNRNVFLSLHFSHRLQRSKPAGVGGCCDQQPSFFRMPTKEVLHLSAAFLAQALSVHQDVSVLLYAGKPRAHARKCAGDPALHQWPRFLDPQSKHSTHLPAPAALGKMGQILTGRKSDSVIIYANARAACWGKASTDHWNPACPYLAAAARPESL